MNPCTLAGLMHLSLVLATFGCMNAAVAQSILSIEELDRNGKVYQLSDSRSVVDINSLLRIRIDRDAMRHSIVQNAADGPTMIALLADVSALNAIAETGLAATDTLREALDAFLLAPDPDPGELQRALTPAASSALEAIELLQPGDPWRDTLNARLEQDLAESADDPFMKTYRLVFEAARDKAADLNAELDRTLSSEQVYVRLAGWIATPEGNRPVHLPGFDDLPPGERYFVSPWELSMTVDQRQQFEQQQHLAQRIHSEGAGVLKEVLESSTQQHVTAQLENVAGCTDDVLDALSMLVRSARTEAFLPALTKTQTFADLVRDLVSRYRNVSLPEVIAPAFPVTLQQDLQTFLAESEAFLAVIDELRALGAQENPSGVAAERIRTAVESGEHCSSAVTAGHAALATFGGLIGGVSDIRNVASSNLEMTDKVLKIQPEDVAEQVDVSLVNTGPRREEDVFVLRLVTGREGEFERELAFKQVTLMRVLPHLQMAPALLFAYRTSERPEAGGQAIEGAFQAAPSYSVLIKGGGRRRLGFRRLVDPGVGLNVATLDFDRDDDLEVGLGAVVSAFRDYLQAGVGFNLQENKAYGFFGVNLPIATLNVQLPP